MCRLLLLLLCGLKLRMRRRLRDLFRLCACQGLQGGHERRDDHVLLVLGALRGLQRRLEHCLEEGLKLVELKRAVAALFTALEELLHLIDGRQLQISSSCNLLHERDRRRALDGSRTVRVCMAKHLPGEGEARVLVVEKTTRPS